MALIVTAGQYVQTTINITNTGTLPYSFRVKAVVVPSGSLYLAKEQTFYNNSGYNSSNPPPLDSDYITTSPVDPSDYIEVIMYTNMWGDGEPFKYVSDQTFDVVLEITILETSQKFLFREENVLQHQQTTTSQPFLTSSFNIV